MLADSDVGPLLAALAATEGVYGLAYGAIRQKVFRDLRLTRAELSKLSVQELYPLRAALDKAGPGAAALALVAVLIAGFTLPTSISLVREIGPGGAFSTIKALFGLAAVLAWGIAIVASANLVRLLRRRTTVRQRLRP